MTLVLPGRFCWDIKAVKRLGRRGRGRERENKEKKRMEKEITKRVCECLFS